MIRWGIIGAGNIARRFAAALAYDKRATLEAVACRTVSKAEAFQKAYGGQKAYGSYEEILEDPSIDIVYIALPHSHHYEWSKKAILHHKAVLCEKPAMMNAKEMEEIATLARKEKVFFMEAMKTRFVPAYRNIKKRIEDGLLGDIKAVHTTYCSDVTYTDTSYHFYPGEGGCILDTGIYAIGYVVEYLKQPIIMQTITSKTHSCGVETYCKASFVSGNMQGSVECAFDRAKPKQAIIVGTKDTLIIEDLHRPTKAYLDSSKEVLAWPYEHDDFYSQIAHVNNCYLQQRLESPIMTLQDSIDCATLVDKMKAGIVW